MNKRKSYGRCILFFSVLLLGIIMMVPVGITLWVSIRFSGKFSLMKFYNLFGDCLLFYRCFWNSILYSFSITLGAMVIGVLAAFGLKFSEFPGKRALYVIYIVLMMMPLQVTLLPNYIGLRTLGILNSPIAIILPLLFSPFCVVILFQYMKEYREECVEAARLETSSTIRIIVWCILPDLRACLFAAALFVFAESWNLVEQPLLYLEEDTWKNLALLFSEPKRFQEEVLQAAGVIFMIPVFLWYLMFHKELKSIRLENISVDL